MRIQKTEPIPLPVRRDPARPLFAIGDIHGHADALEALLGHLDREIAERHPETEVDLVYLGDFVDRGPQPLETLQLAARGLGRPLVRETALMGNHDLFLIAEAELADRTSSMTEWTTWMSNGGRETLSAMEIHNPFRATPTLLREKLGPELCDFLSGLALTYRTGDFLCVHAGVDPIVELDEQIEFDLIWVREPFLTLAEDPEAPWTIGVTVVHGHTPDAYGVFAHRIGVDTGGFATGVFSAIEVWDGVAQFHHAMR